MEKGRLCTGLTKEQGGEGESRGHGGHGRVEGAAHKEGEAVLGAQV